jgi:hypothetical protein
VPSLGYKNVGRLDVSMHDSSRMSRVKGVSYLHTEIQDFPDI